MTDDPTGFIIFMPVLVVLAVAAFAAVIATEDWFRSFKGAASAAADAAAANPPMSDDLKAKVADGILRHAIGMRRDRGEELAQAALQAIHDAGFAVVPCEATDAMLKARLDVMQYGSWGYDHEADERRRYTAMISAAQHNTEEKT